MKNPQQNPLKEVAAWLVDFTARCRAKRWVGALFWVGVTEDIVSDVVRIQRTVSAAAYAAEQEDLEAAKLIEEAACDGLTADDLPKLRQAARLARKSANRDRQICDSMAS